MRGIIYQYAVSLFIILGVDPVLSLRGVSILANIAALPAIYLIGRLTFGKVSGFAAVILFSISIWEIEFSRFGRMYAPFQAVFVWYLVYLLRASVYGKPKHLIMMYVFSIFGILLWEGGAILFVLNFLPFFYRSELAVPSRIIFTSILFLVAYYYINYRFSPAITTILPSDALPLDKPNLVSRDPVLLGKTLLHYPQWIAVLIALIVYSAYCFLRNTLTDQYPWVIKLMFLTLFIVAILNQFFLAVILIVIFHLVGLLDKKEFRKKIYKHIPLLLGLFFIFWLIYGLVTDMWHSQFPNSNQGELGLYKLMVVLFKYPNIYDSILYVWFETYPKLSSIALIVFLSTLFFVLTRDDHAVKAVRILLVVLILSSLIIGIKETLYIETRYTFFLFPIFLIFLPGFVYFMLRKVNLIKTRNIPLLSIVTTLAIFSYTEDFSFAHMLEIDSEKVNYRKIYNDNLKQHYYPRYDFRTPAQYINQHSSENDSIIITATPFEYYLERLDYVYVNYRHTEFRNIARMMGKKEKWTNAKLIYKIDQLKELVDKECNHTWIINKSGDRNMFEKEVFSMYSIYTMYISQDDEYEVYKIPPGKNCDRN